MVKGDCYEKICDFGSAGIFSGKPKLLGNDRTQIQESIAVFHEVQPEEIQLELVQDAEEQGETYRFAVYMRRDKKEDRDWKEEWDFPIWQYSSSGETGIS